MNKPKTRPLPEFHGDVDLIRIELERVRVASGGELRPSAVVDSARDEASPIHTHFEWDDTIAGEKFRETQARQLIRVVVERRIPDDDDGNGVRLNVRVRQYLSLPEQRGTGGGYVHVSDVREDPELRAQMLRQAIYDVERAARSPQYNTFDELDKFRSEILNDCARWKVKLDAE